MKRRIGYLLTPWLLTLLVACDSQPEPETTGGQSTKSELETRTKEQPAGEAADSSLSNQPRSDKVRGLAFEVELVRLERGNLSFRKGQDFFAEQEIEIVLFADREDLYNTRITVPREAGHTPHIRYGLSSEKGGVPDTETSMSGYTLDLTFGPRETFGVPVTIDLNDPKQDSSLQGSFFATLGDIRVTEGGKLDATYDSFDTQQYLADKYVAEQYPDATITRQGAMSRRGAKEPEAPKLGLVGFELLEGGEHRLLRLGMIKKPGGVWEIEGEIPAGQLMEAHWKDEYKALGFELPARKIKAAAIVEERFRQEDIFPHFRGESITCSEADRDGTPVALCHVSYNLSKGDSDSCEKFAFLMQREAGSWVYDRGVDFHQRLVAGGKLEPKEPDNSFFFSRDCPMLKEYSPVIPKL